MNYIQRRRKRQKRSMEVTIACIAAFNAAYAAARDKFLRGIYKFPLPGKAEMRAACRKARRIR